MSSPETTPEAPPVIWGKCASCGCDVVEDEGTDEGGTLYHYACLPLEDDCDE